MVNINFVQPQSTVSEKKLSVVVSTDSFLYGVTDDGGVLTAAGYFSGLKYEHPDSLSPIYEDRVLQGVYDQITVCSKQLPVLHMETQDDQLYNYYPSFADHKVFKEKFTGVDIFAYFGLNPDQMRFLNSLLGKFRLHHFSMLLADYYYPGDAHKLLAHFDEKWVHIYYSNTEGFRFYNVYPMHSNEDGLYFLLTVYRHLGLDPMKDPVWCSGLIDKNSALYKLLHGYFAWIDFETPKGITINPPSEELPSHYYFDIVVTALCV